VAPHVAIDIGYTLDYIQVSGVGFKDSSYSEVTVMFPGYSSARVDDGARSETTRLPGATISGFTVRSIWVGPLEL
jgi:hypothetical protein